MNPRHEREWVEIRDRKQVHKNCCVLCSALINLFDTFVFFFSINFIFLFLMDRMEVVWKGLIHDETFFIFLWIDYILNITFIIY